MFAISLSFICCRLFFVVIVIVILLVVMLYFGMNINGMCVTSDRFVHIIMTHLRLLLCYIFDRMSLLMVICQSVSLLSLSLIYSNLCSINFIWWLFFPRKLKFGAKNFVHCVFVKHIDGFLNHNISSTNFMYICWCYSLNYYLWQYLSQNENNFVLIERKKNGINIRFIFLRPR